MRNLLVILFVLVSISVHAQLNIIGALLGEGKVDTISIFGRQASFAYSLRSLDTAIVDPTVIRVRRSSDNTEQDFTASDIMDGTLTTFTGSGDGFVVTWYDQSGKGRNATAVQDSDEPQIVDGGYVITDINGLPALYFDGTDDWLQADGPFGMSGTNKKSFFFVARDQDAAGQGRIFEVGNGTQGSDIELFGMTREWGVRVDGSNNLWTITRDTSEVRIVSIISPGDSVHDIKIRVDGYSRDIDYSTRAANAELATADTYLDIGESDAYGANSNMYIQELIGYSSDMTSSQESITDSLYSYYKGPRYLSDITTDSLVAAYSLRYVNRAYVGNPVARLFFNTDTTYRDVTPNELIDSAEIWASTTGAFINTLYDQSGNGFDVSFIDTSAGTLSFVVNGGTFQQDIKGFPYINFPNDAVLEDTAATFGLTDSIPRSIFTFVRPDAALTADDIVVIGDGTTAIDSQYFRFTAEWAVRTYGDNILFTSEAVTNNEVITSLLYYGGTTYDVNLWVNGLNASPDANGGFDAKVLTEDLRLSIGGYTAAGNDHYDGRLYEVFIFNDSMTNQRSDIQNYMGEYYARKQAPEISGFETDAVGHWLFGPNATSLKDTVNANTAIDNNSQTYSSTYLTNSLDGAVESGMETGFFETPNMTMVTVWRANTADGGPTISAFNQIFNGTGGTYTAENGGLSNHIGNGDQLYFNMGGTGAGGAQVIEDLTGESGWIWVASTIDADGNYIGMRGDSVTHTIISGTSTRVQSDSVIAIGNLYYPVAGNNEFADLAEFILFDKAKTEKELIDIYWRSKARLEDRGITIN